ncbi:unnamed protein product [Durusdinium trenchii]|uniref:Uncharacterized protein n=2 Tax=Durusdinium trenchii TaxID=1381693 RepID=A0ABP0LZA6_9DINO
MESKAPPDLSDGEVIIIPYADNLNVAGIDEQRVQQVKNKIVDRLREIGFRVHEELEACSIGQSLGFLVDGAKGVVAPIPERLHKVRLALDWLARQPWVTGKKVERLIGHCVHFMLLRRELLSIFRAMYDFVHKSYSKKRPLFASAAREAKWASALLGLCSVDLRKDWSGRLCRRLCALLLCADSMLSPRWIPSELNVADKGSRRWESQRKRDVAGRAWEKIQLERVDSAGRRPADKAKTRAEIARQRSDPPRFKGQTNLERVAVSEAVAKDYTRRTNDLRFFARQSKISLRSAKNLDEACTLFLNNIFEQGVELHEGSKFVAAVKDAFPDFGHKSALPRMIRALQGWTKIDPQKTRPPLPWELVAGIAMKMQARTRHHAALAVLTMFSAYLRPGECLGIQKTDLVRPMPRQEHHTLHLHPAERHEASKVGISEESIQLDSVQLLWLGQALEQLQTDGPFLFELGHAEMVSAWKQALVDLGLEHNHAVLHQL